MPDLATWYRGTQEQSFRKRMKLLRIAMAAFFGLYSLGAILLVLPTMSAETGTMGWFGFVILCLFYVTVTLGMTFGLPLLFVRRRARMKRLQSVEGRREQEQLERQRSAMAEERQAQKEAARRRRQAASEAKRLAAQRRAIQKNPAAAKGFMQARLRSMRRDAGQPDSSNAMADHLRNLADPFGRQLASLNEAWKANGIAATEHLPQLLDVSRDERSTAYETIRGALNMSVNVLDQSTLNIYRTLLSYGLCLIEGSAHFSEMRGPLQALMDMTKDPNSQCAPAFESFRIDATATSTS
jgi:flagellar biosynthesis GTPase FlhF